MKSFKVQVWYGANKTELILSATNAAQAISLAKKIYTTGRVISAQEIK